MHGSSHRLAPRATKKTRTPAAAWTPTFYRARRWRARRSAGYSSSARSWMSPGTWEGSIFSGLGLQAPPPGAHCENRGRGLSGSLLLRISNVFFVRPLEVFNLAFVEMPDARGHFVNHVMVVRDQQHGAVVPLQRDV